MQVGDLSAALLSALLRIPRHPRVPAAHPTPTDAGMCRVGFPRPPRPRWPRPASRGPWLVRVTPEVAVAFWWPSPSPFPLPRSPVSFIRNPRERGQGWGPEGFSPGSGRGRGPGAPLTAEASLTHPATHVPLYGQGFLSVLKGDCEKSRADSGCLAVSWQQAWQEVFLSPPPHSLLCSAAPLPPVPPASCVVYH